MNAFKIFGLWGEILSHLDSPKFWTALVEDSVTRTISATKEDESKNRVHSLNVRLNDVDGGLEGHPISSYHDYDDVFERVSYIVNLLEVQEFKRLGVRFFFLEAFEGFEAACRLYASQVRPEYWQVFDQEPSDISIVSIHTDGDQRLRLATGPLKRDEYPAWFAAPRDVKPESALLFDVDCVARPYKGGKFDLKKLVALYYQKALGHSERVRRILGPEVKNGSV